MNNDTTKLKILQEMFESNPDFEGRYRYVIWNDEEIILEARSDTAVLCGFTRKDQLTYSFNSNLTARRAAVVTDLIHMAGQLQVASRQAVREVQRIAPELTMESVQAGIGLVVKNLEKRIAEQGERHENEE